MLITDYASLLTAVERQTVKDDLSEDFPGFVQRTEATMQRRLRTLDGETSTTLTASTELTTLPADLLSIRAIHLAGDEDEGLPDLPLSAISPTTMANQYSGFEGSPMSYSITGNKLRLSPPPDEEVTLAIDYQAKFTSLTAIATNWIITNHPDVYFYGVTAQAYAHERDEAAGTYAALFVGAMDDLMISRGKDRWGPNLSMAVPVRQILGAKC